MTSLSTTDRLLSTHIVRFGKGGSYLISTTWQLTGRPSTLTDSSPMKCAWSALAPTTLYQSRNTPSTWSMNAGTVPIGLTGWRLDWVELLNRSGVLVYWLNFGRYRKKSVPSDTATSSPTYIPVNCVEPLPFHIKSYAFRPLHCDHNYGFGNGLCSVSACFLRDRRMKCVLVEVLVRSTDVGKDCGNIWWPTLSKAVGREYARNYAEQEHSSDLRRPAAKQVHVQIVSAIWCPKRQRRKADLSSIASLSRFLTIQNLADRGLQPLATVSRLTAFRSKRGGDVRGRHSRFGKFLHTFQGFSFARIKSVRFPAFTPATLRFRPLSCRFQFHNDHRLLVFMKGTHDLPHQFP